MATCHVSIFTKVSILCLCFSTSSSSSQTTFTLSLTQHIPVPSQELPEETNQHPYLRTINYLVSSSLARVRRLKNLNDSSSASISQVPLFAQGSDDGYYSVFLTFGSPSQNLSYFMDTGSSLVWFPCTSQYKCSDCPTSGVYPNKTTVFMPQLSSSAKILGCNDEKCQLVRASTPGIILCSSKKNCYYEQGYAIGNTSGLLLSETLHFPEGDVTDFAVGCSTSSTRPPLGLVGFGRGRESLPAQMGLKKFSYCLVSHQFDDDETVSSELVLVRGSSNSGAGEGGIRYTKFRKNPAFFNEYYYLNLRNITVGGTRVEIPYGFLVPQSDGNGGTIIDSGTTFTTMDEPIYNLVAKEFENQMSMYNRDTYVESQSGFPLCFDIKGKKPVYPELMFHFKGGAKLSLPMADNFVQVGEAACMTIVSIGLDSSIGPSIIIGNYQQQDIYMEYDLENGYGRLGFKKEDLQIKKPE
ncbi:hypothetical protein L1887_30892 [Cichorium endivia]|nr:hypothetical protein L1887_30892 [Cichorium endivia]